jgi:predicted metal-binding membrane protein
LAKGTVPLATLVRRDRAVIVAALAGVTGLAWLYLHGLVAGGMDMSGGGDMAGMAMLASAMPWTARDFALALAMWWVMMIGMMVPSASPMILTFATVNRRKREREQPFAPTAAFVAGYLVAWGAFSVAATAAQRTLQDLALLSAAGAPTAPLAGRVLFVMAGLYQVTPLKYACLRRCRSPLDFVLNGWRDGIGGALKMGMTHGLYCLGCCWALMILLFAEGVMNLLWVAALSAVVLVEKLFPAGQWIARTSGVLMLVFGIYLLMQL